MKETKAEESLAGPKDAQYGQLSYDISTHESLPDRTFLCTDRHPFPLRYQWWR